MFSLQMYGGFMRLIVRLLCAGFDDTTRQFICEDLVRSIFLLALNLFLLLQPIEVVAANLASENAVSASKNVASVSTVSDAAIAERAVAKTTIAETAVATSTLPATGTGAAASTLPAASPIKAAIPNHARAILKNGNHFLVMDENGLMPSGSDYGTGLYRDDTRYLTEWNVSLNGVGLTPLSNSTTEGYAGRFIYSNQEYAPRPEVHVAAQKIMIQRDIVIRDAVVERLVVTSFDTAMIHGRVDIKYASDFADMFEVRGMPRKRRGELLPAKVSDSKKEVTLSYKGLDGQVMKTKISFTRATPSSIDAGEARFDFDLRPKGVYIFETVISTNFNESELDVASDEKLAEPLKKYTYVSQKAKADGDYEVWQGQNATITTDNSIFNRLIDRGVRDLYILRQSTPKGECLAAGTPWYAVAFGRDQDISGRETVGLMPELSKSILSVLAAYQGTKYDGVTEESPGKIMHELRLGEMARCKEIAFRPYYGSIDCTPLWLVLLGEYVDWTGDTAFAKAHWKNVLSALECLDREAGTGYLIYGTKAGAALSNQGWKDSGDSIMDINGQLAKPPIALCEVQGYLYQAWRSTAKLAHALGENSLADQLNKKADGLKTRFNKDFYSTRREFVALALDGDGKQCEVISSNPGHLLVTGILDPAKVTAVCDKLINPEMFCGWGIRTLSALDMAYNPVSYHDGSVWPHDNAMAVEGMCKVGRAADAMKVMDGMFYAAQGHMNLRLPELFCGFSRHYSENPVWYPVSCEPQAWAAGAMFMMLKSSLGLTPDALNHELRVVRPELPPFLTNVKIANIYVGDTVAALEFNRINGKTTCKVLSKSDGLKVTVE
jgi:glycogen debranching enzyme